MLLTGWLALFTARLGSGGLVPRPRPRRRPRPVTLTTHLETLETRAMLSGITSGADAPVVGRAGIPIAIDVLSNDSSTAAGPLEIVSVSAADYGSVAIIEADPAATGPEGNDRVEFTADTDFVGDAEFSYVVEDADGNQATVAVTASVTGADGGLAEDADGALGVSGGLGASGYLISPTSGYTPSVSGNYGFSEAQSGALQGDVVVAGQSQTGTGTQTATRTVNVTSAANGDWTYSEVVAWTYDLNGSDGAGNDNHIWGGSNYTFTAGSVAGVQTTTLLFMSNDNYDAWTTSVDATSTYANHMWGSSLSTQTVQNVNNPAGLGSGSQSGTSSVTGNSAGIGNYTYAVTGGSVSGTLNGSGNNSGSSNYAFGWAEDVFGNWVATGILGGSGNGSNTFSYTGSGTYGDANFSGTINESGGQNSSSNYMFSGALAPDLTLVMTGNGTQTGSQHANYSYGGTGTFSTNVDGVSKNGATQANGANNSTSDYNVTFAMVAGEWVTTGGTGSGDGNQNSYSAHTATGTYIRSENGGTVSGSLNEDGHNDASNSYNTTSTLAADGGWLTSGSGNGSGSFHSHSDFTGVGTYSRSENGGTVSGTLNEDGHSNASNSYTTSRTLSEGSPDWLETGTGSAADDGDTHTDYTGTGTYSKTEGTAGGPSYSTVSGTVDESGSKDSAYNSTSQWSLNATTWELGSGTGTETGGTISDKSHTGSGTYTSDRTEESGRTSSVSGTINDSGGDTNSESWSAASEVVNGQWVRTSGSGSGSGTTNGAHDSNGSGTYQQTAAFGALVSGTLSESENQAFNSTFTTSSTWDNDHWVETGTDTGNGSYVSSSNFDGSGVYGWVGRSNASGTGTSSVNGTVNEDGDDNSTGSYTQIRELDGEGNWVPTSGTGSDSGNHNSHSDYTGNGTYSTSGNDPEIGTWTVNGTNTSSGSENGTSDWQTVSEIQDGLWVEISGAKSGSGDNQTHSSSSGTGTYNYSDANRTMSGTVTQSVGHNESKNWNTNSTFIPNTPEEEDPWGTTGTGSGTSDGNSDFSWSVDNGTYQYDVAGGAVNGTTTAYCFRNSTSSSGFGLTLGADGEWDLSSGSGTVTDTEGEGITYTGSGSFSQSGDIVEAENGSVVGSWTFNGSVTESGDQSDGAGGFSNSTVQDGAWVESDWGVSVTSMRTQSDSWNGSGSYSNGALSGAFSRGAGYDFSWISNVNDGENNGLTGTAELSFAATTQNDYLGSGTFTFEDATGTLTVSGNGSGTLDESTDFELIDTTGEGDTEFVATSGSRVISGSGAADNSFIGAGAYGSAGNGITGTIGYSFGASGLGSGDEVWELDATTQEWSQTSGTGSASGNSYSNYSKSGTGNYDAPHGLSGTETESFSDNWTSNWSSSDTFADGAWSKSGSGSLNGNSVADNSYNTSGSFGTGSLSGNYSEDGHTHWDSTYQIATTVDSNGDWQTSAGSADTNSDGHSHTSLSTAETLRASA